MSKLVFDVETDGLQYTKIWCIVAQDVDTEEIRSFGPSELAEGLEYLKTADTLIGHNILTFDIPCVRKILDDPYFARDKEILDTLVLSRLFGADRESGHKLADWGKILGFPKIEFDDYSHYSVQMLKYCIRDVELNTKVFHELRSEAKGFSRQCIDLEHKVAEILGEQERYGFLLDFNKAGDIHAELGNAIIKTEKRIHEVFKPKNKETKLYPKYKKDGSAARNAITENGEGTRLSDVEFAEMQQSGTKHVVRTEVKELNISSRQQLIEYLKDFGWKPRKFTKKGNVILNEKILEEITDIPEAAYIQKYFLLQKRITQLNSWIKEADSATFRVHSHVIHNGTVTGRMTHRSPNMAQVPSVSVPYGKAFRGCWRVPDKYKLVGIDASGLELRMLAHYMNDEDYINEIISGDIHTANQKLAGLKSRDQAKTFIYSLLYGAGDEKLGSVAGGNKDTGAKLRKSFFDNLPAFANLRNRVSRTVQKNGCLKGLDGRKLKIRSEHSALNALLQGAGAIVMKEALVILNNKLAVYDAHFVANVHDEWQIEVVEEDADYVGQLGVEAIEEAGVSLNLHCPLTGEYKVGDNWSDTH
jgi:DNA polymerase I-like protein with 3'-5' exonuclease and polymerase domains